MVKQADQVVMVDLTPRALLKRLARGAVYPPDQVQKALEHFFQESRLMALRELALRQTAHEVEIRQVEDDSSRFEPTHTDGHDGEKAPRRVEGILIFVTPDPLTAMLIRRGKRVADYLHADCLAVAVCRNPDLRDTTSAEREAVERHLNFARALHIEARVLQGHDIAKTLVEFAKLNGVTQLLLARSAQTQKQAPLTNLVLQVVRLVMHLAHDMQVMIVADRGSRAHFQSMSG